MNKQKPALVLGKSSGLPDSNGFINVQSETQYTNKPALQPGIPADAHLTNVRVGRSVVSIGIGGYTCPDPIPGE